jgi:hypothetical protein
VQLNHLKELRIEVVFETLGMVFDLVEDSRVTLINGIH